MASGDGKPTVVDRPVSTPGDDAPGDASPDATPTALERPASGPSAVGSRDPGAAGEPRRSSRRSIPPGGPRYQSGDELGRGGMGRVVEATDTLLDRRVAVKEALTTDPELLRRFARETKITARLEHPSIVPVYDAGIADGAPFYVMRRVSGRPLSELIREAASLNARLALVPHLLAAAQAIAHAHGRGIIHRDVKPSNILVGALGETVVIDWGLAKVIGEADDDGEGGAPEPDAAGSLRTRLGAVFGTPGFMAPDQLRGDPVGPQGDVYALGASLYNLLSGKPPHHASDSTLMMKLAAQGPPTPIAELVPGVPAELSTIVDTAIAYDPARRYPDAGAFAEELERFLAGQLVASHRYSRTEHLVRFVRKHRAAIAIASAALVVVAVIGTFAVTQVVEERDRADAQARLATQGRHEAEAARAMADERADQLLLSRARTLVDANPTATVASLKQLSPHSKLVDEALGLIRAARLRGVAWAMKASDEHTAFATLDQTGQRLAQITSEGKVQVFDLEARRRVFEVDLVRGTQLRWILDGEVLMAAGRGKTRMFTTAGVERATDLPELDKLETDERGVNLIAADVRGRALRVDLVRGTTHELGSGATAVAISADGSHVAVTTATTLTVYDHANTAIVQRRHAGSPTQVTIGTTSVTVLDGPAVFEAPLARGARWTEPKRPDVDLGQPFFANYIGDRLFVIFTDGLVAIRAGDRLDALGRVEVTSGGMQRFGYDYLAIGGDGRRIHYVDGTRLRELPVAIALRFMRVVSRPRSNRVVAVGDGAIVVIELDTLPRLLSVQRHMSTVFVTDRWLLSGNGFNFDFTWHDLATGTARAIELEAAGQIRSYDRETGRVLIVEATTDGRRAKVFAAGETIPAHTVAAAFDEIQLVDRGLVYADRNQVFGGLVAGRYAPLFRTDGDVNIIVRLGGTRYAVIAEHELVRADLATGELVRLSVPDAGAITYATADRDALVVARDDRLLRWTTTLDELAQFEAPIEYVYTIQRGLVVGLKNHSTMYVSPDGTQTRLASTRGTVQGTPDRIIVPGQHAYDVIELPSFARWPLPIARSPDAMERQIDLSPNGRLILERTRDGRIWLWKLPRVDRFEDALTVTNFTEDANGLLLWPWQAPDPQR